MIPWDIWTRLGCSWSEVYLFDIILKFKVDILKMTWNNKENKTSHFAIKSYLVVFKK